MLPYPVPQCKHPWRCCCCWKFVLFVCIICTFISSPGELSWRCLHLVCRPGWPVAIAIHCSPHNIAGRKIKRQDCNKGAGWGGCTGRRRRKKCISFTVHLPHHAHRHPARAHCFRTGVKDEHSFNSHTAKKPDTHWEENRHHSWISMAACSVCMQPPFPTTL